MKLYYMQFDLCFVEFNFWRESECEPQPVSAGPRPGLLGAVRERRDGGGEGHQVDDDDDSDDDNDCQGDEGGQRGGAGTPGPLHFRPAPLQHGAQHPGHQGNQSEASIKVTWSASTYEGPRLRSLVHGTVPVEREVKEKFSDKYGLW